MSGAKARWWLFAALAGFYATTQQRSDWTYGWDGYCRYRMLDALIQTGSPVVDEPGFYPMFHVGASVAMLPLYLVGEMANRLVGVEGRDFAAEACFFFYGLVTAASAMMVARILGRLGVTVGKAVAVGAIFGVATMAWPYAGEMQSEPLVALCLLGAFDRLLDRGPGRGLRPATVAGLWGALAILTRPESILLAVPMFIFFCANRPRWAEVLVLIGVTATGFLGVMGWNWLRFGSPFTSGYAVTVGPGQEDQSVRFTTPWLLGWYGQLFSSGKGVFWYNPILVLACLGWPTWLRGERCGAGYAALGTVLATAGLYAAFWNWAGDASWGPRYLLIALPFACLPLAWLRPETWGPVGKVAAVFLLALSIGVQVLGAWVPIKDDYLPAKRNLAWRQTELELKLGDDNDTLLHYVPRLSPLLGHWERFAGWQTGLRWFPYDAERGRRWDALGLFLAAGTLGATIGLSRTLRRGGSAD